MRVRNLTKRFTSSAILPLARELLEQFETEAQGHQKGSPEASGFFAKVREFFDKGT